MTDTVTLALAGIETAHSLSLAWPIVDQGERSTVLPRIEALSGGGTPETLIGGCSIVRALVTLTAAAETPAQASQIASAIIENLPAGTAVTFGGVPVGEVRDMPRSAGPIKGESGEYRIPVIVRLTGWSN